MPSKTFAVQVTTRASRQAVTLQPDGLLKVKLTSAPVDGRANAELIKLLANYFNTAKSNVEIIKGLTGRKKLVTIHSIKNPK
jgi:hypothetical protein